MAPSRYNGVYKGDVATTGFLFGSAINAGTTGDIDEYFSGMSHGDTATLMLVFAIWEMVHCCIQISAGQLPLL